MKPIISKITDKWIEKNNPCKKAIEWWDKTERNPIRILELLIKDKRYSWANWYIIRIMQYKMYVRYAVYAAEQVIDIFEKEYPDDKRPRQAIEAAKKCIQNPTRQNKAAAEAAARAAWAVRAAGAAAWAAWAVWAVWAARAVRAAGAAEAAAEAAAGAAGAAEAMQLKILQYGMSLIKRR